jgi:hypothetical protein
MQYIYGLYKHIPHKPGKFSLKRIKYIGRTDNPDYRLSKHIESKDKTNGGILGDWIRESYDKKAVIKMTILETCEDYESVEREKYYINKFKSNGLKNIISNPNNSPKNLKIQISNLLKENKRLKEYIDKNESLNVEDYQKTLPSYKKLVDTNKHLKQKLKLFILENRSLKSEMLQ